MSPVMVDVLDGLPAGVREVLAAAPDDHTMTVDLVLDWDAVDPACERAAERLRVTAASRDPLGWLPARGDAAASVVGRREHHGVLLCLHLPALVARAEARGEPFAARIADLAGTVVSSAAAHEAALVAGSHTRLVARGRVPGLLTPTLGAPAIPPPRISGVSGDWAPVDMDTLVAVVEAAFGPVELDRRPVAFTVAHPRRSGCPGCRGERLGFPEELTAARTRLCRVHLSEAERLAAERFERAQRRSPESWEALWRAERRAHRPRIRIAGHLADRLADAVERGTVPTTQELREEANLALELAEHYAGDPHAFAATREADWEVHEWVLNLPRDLARGGLVDEAVEVADVLGDVDRDQAQSYAADAALVLAEAGRAGEALTRVDLNLKDFPDDPGALVDAANACAAAGSDERAEALLREAVVVARKHGDPEEVHEAYENLLGFLTLQGGRARDVNRVRRERQAWSRQTGWVLDAAWSDGHDHTEPVAAPQPVRRTGPKVGRNEPCPCGSGKKHKRCCGAQSHA